MNHSPDLTSPAPADTYAGDVPRPAEPPQIGPNATSAADSPAPREPRSRWARLWHNLGRDSVLIAPSLLISLIAFPVLITLFSASIATVIVWVGVILLPLTLTVARDGEPVTDLQPYLAAYGHLVALRVGDLGYLHVHPEGAPGDGVTAPGPEITFMAVAPSDGVYRLYLDFLHDGVVRTAEFTVRTTATVPGPDAAHSHEGHHDAHAHH